MMVIFKKMFEAKPDKSKIVLKDVCSDCGCEIIIGVTPSSGGIASVGDSYSSLGLNIMGCFIATAAFGSKFEKHVQLLRRFRDFYLMPNSIGRTFVKAY